MRSFLLAFSFLLTACGAPSPDLNLEESDHSQLRPGEKRLSVFGLASWNIRPSNVLEFTAYPDRKLLQREVYYSYKPEYRVTTDTIYLSAIAIPNTKNDAEQELSMWVSIPDIQLRIYDLRDNQTNFLISRVDTRISKGVFFNFDPPPGI